MRTRLQYRVQKHPFSGLLASDTTHVFAGSRASEPGRRFGRAVFHAAQQQQEVAGGEHKDARRQGDRGEAEYPILDIAAGLAKQLIKENKTYS